MLFSKRRRLGIAIETKDIGLELRRKLGKAVAGELGQQIGIGLVCESVFARRGDTAGVEIAVVDDQRLVCDCRQLLMILFPRIVDALHVELFGLGRRHLEIEGLQRADLGQNAEEKGQDAVAEVRPLVLVAPFAAIFAFLQMVEESLLGSGRIFLDDLIFFMANATRVICGISRLTE